jgi:tetratricopeptide (TPR) repeat protein
MDLSAPPGLLGVTLESWSQRRDEILKLITENSMEEAAALYSRAAKAGELSEYDDLVCRISLIPESDRSKDKERLQRLGKLLGMTPEDNFTYVGTTLFYEAHRYYAAAFFLERATNADPRDLSAKLNLGLTYSLSGRYAEADRIADELLSRSSDLGAFAQSVALKTKAFALEGRDDYASAAQYFRQALEKVGNDDDLSLRMRYLLSLAKLRDIAAFEEGVAFCNRSPGEIFPKRRFYIDALRAYILVANGQRAQAIQTIEKWRDNADARRRVVEYWSTTRNAADVADTWADLMKN